MTNINTEKLGIQTHTITYADGSSEIIKPVTWKYLSDVQILQYQIISNTAENQGSLCDILNTENKGFWDPAKKLAALMPIVGSDKKGIDLEKIEEVGDLVDLFITTTQHRDPETGFIAPAPGEGYIKPSIISRLNGINFIRLLMEVLQKNNETN